MVQHIRLLSVVFAALTVILGCSLSGTAGTESTGGAVVQSPTDVPAVPATDAPIVNAPPTTVPTQAESVACDAAAMSVNVQVARQEAAQMRTLPNGRPFPAKNPPRNNLPNRPDATRVMIQFAPNTPPNERNAYINSINGRSRRQVDGLDMYAVTLGRNSSPENLPSSPYVLRVEIDHIATSTQIDMPNDPRFSEQWSLPVVGLPLGWTSAVNNATPVTVAVIDSGICAAHPDLAGRVVAGYDFVDDDTNPDDTFGHGCSVAGVIAANINNGEGMAGVAPNVRIMPLRVLDGQGLGDYSAISAAIIYAADNGAQVINLSLAGTFYSQVMADAVAYAQARGVTVIAAAGNAGTNIPFYPAAFGGVIAVGSLDSNMQRSSFSNYGTHVQTFVPGRDILVTTRNGGYDFNSGTSFAAPIVAGLEAIARAGGGTLVRSEQGVYIAPPPNAVCGG